jgi:hypothetical protein
MENIGMNEYISKEYIRNVVLKHWGNSVGAECYAYARVLDVIGDTPVADVVEVKHGKWIHEKYALCCSVCGTEIPDRMLFVDDGEKWIPLYHIDYCGKCGAEMNGGKV